MQKREFSTEVGGKKLTATFSDLADQTNGSVVLTYGKTSVLATAVMSESEREGIDFFPLVVDYEEKFYAAGEILGSRFVRREGKPSDEAVLSGRVVDRTIRPLFDQQMRREVQIVITILALDEDDPDILAVNAASLALAVSDIPFRGPVSAVRVGKVKESGALVVNPSYKLREGKNLLADATICGKDGTINTIEVGAYELSEKDAEEMLLAASEEIIKIQEFQKNIVEEMGKEKWVFEKKEESAALRALFLEHVAPRLMRVVFAEGIGAREEKAGKAALHECEREWVALAKEHLSPEDAKGASFLFNEEVNRLIHREALENNRRADGRGMDEIRPLYAQAGGVSPVLHGTGVFYRGGTHVLSVATLGGPKDAQLVEGMEVQRTKRFMHHYNFPPFSTGETGRLGGMNRRMIGHGALAEKALEAIIPEKERFPYTIRIVSEALASNGSTSMASVCASTLALMDAGVPIKTPVAGIAIGLMLENQELRIKNQEKNHDSNSQIPDTRYQILTDIQGPEDHHGDMDFKVAGTADGITAVQMDVKVDGVPIPILAEAFGKARAARLTILNRITEALPSPRPETSPAAPKIITIKISTDKIGLLIGPGGKTINGIIKETGAEIDIEEDGTVFVLGKNGAAEQALVKVEALTHEYTPGERFRGVVTRLFDFGAMIKIGPNTEGLAHISELAPVRIEKVTDVVNIGDEVPVVVKEIDEKGRVNLSVKAAEPEFFAEKLSKNANGATPHITSTRYGESSSSSRGGFRGSSAGHNGARPPFRGGGRRGF
ncbi:MAG: polyribonucleotide nucleotidyltransferase [Parcubacteria group bacterium]|nr:polyribonucleotide nucleotidyltransferase [Parcubacteria group bacterium]